MEKFNSINAQQMRLLERLRKGPISTVEARHSLDILGVAPRIFELRHIHGHNIMTHWTYQENPGSGTLHRVAEYILLPGKYKRKK
jgi:hypothetical protein